MVRDLQARNNFLDSNSKNKNSQALQIISKIRSAVADGQLHQSDDWEDWNDALIFKEELRAVGEGMIDYSKSAQTIIGYGKFQNLIKSYETSNEPNWLSPVIVFFTELRSDKDFRLERFKILNDALAELIECLDKEFYNKYHSTTSIQ